MKIKFVAIVGMGMLANPMIAQATPIVGAGSGLASSDQTLTFSEAGAIGESTAITNQFAAFGVNFSGGWDFQPDRFDPELVNPNMSGDSLNNFISFASGGNTPLFIEFTVQQNAATFAMVSNFGTSTFTALLGGAGGSIIESFSAQLNGSSNNFFGFQDIVFDTIRIDVGGRFNALLIDNLQSAVAVPEPATLGLLGLGLAGIGVARRKRAS